MKWLIASDIHGSIKHCEHLASRIVCENPDKILLLGDILKGFYFGDEPERVAALLNTFSNKIICVKGNCDHWEDIKLLDFSVSNYEIINFGDKVAYAHHGHMYFDFTKLKKTPDIILSGHTHKPENIVEFGQIQLNPGSVSMPRDGSRHGYMTFKDNTFNFKDLDGEVYDKFCL